MLSRKLVGLNNFYFRFLKDSFGKLMVAAPLILGEDLKISDQNNWGVPEQKITFRGGAKFKGGPKILGGPMNPNDAMVVVLKDILLCLLDFRFIYIVYIS